MPVIASHRFGGARRGWMILRLDDGADVELRRDVFQDRGFANGVQVSPAALDDAVRESQLRQASSVAARFLRERPRSVKEMTDRLAREGVEDSVVQATIAGLVRRGLLNDAAFALVWIESRLSLRPKGRALIARELAQKGISPETVAALLEQTYPAEHHLARDLASRRAKTLRGLDEVVFRRRLGAFLLRRGFERQAVMDLVEELWREVAEPRTY